MHLVHVTTDEDEAQGRGVVEPHCPVPFVKLNTDILETESLNLLAEATFVDTLLTALPVGFLYQVLGVVKYCSQFLIFLWCVLQVLSEEEQHAPFQLLRLTRLVYTVGCFLTFLFEL